ncbi:MAG: hypothetical protein ACFN4K_09770 [Pauljensenia sp.]
MGQQRGTFYWDDDSLSPGNRSEGGWSENLFDDDGNLRGHARFIPDPDSDDDGYTYSPYDDPPMFMSSETRWDSEDEDDSPVIDLLAEVLAQAVVQLIEDAAAAGFAYAAPRVKKWAEETALPFITGKLGSVKGKLDSVRVPWGKKQDHESAVDETVDGIVVSDEPFEAIEQSDSHATPEPLQIEAKRQKMSNAEAQARLVAAAAAQRFAMEQAYLVSQSDIIGATDVNEVMQQIAAHPQEMLDALIKQLARNPRLLEDGSLAQLASILDLNSVGLNATQQERAPLSRGRDADDGDSGSGE